jgi:hypothetical protein
VSVVVSVVSVVVVVSLLFVIVVVVVVVNPNAVKPVEDRKFQDRQYGLFCKMAHCPGKNDTAAAAAAVVVVSFLFC